MCGRRQGASPQAGAHGALDRLHEHGPDRRLALMFACAHPAIERGMRTPLILQTILGVVDVCNALTVRGSRYRDR